MREGEHGQPFAVVDDEAGRSRRARRRRRSPRRASRRWRTSRSSTSPGSWTTSTMSRSSLVQHVQLTDHPDRPGLRRSRCSWRSGRVRRPRTVRPGRGRSAASCTRSRASPRSRSCVPIFGLSLIDGGHPADDVHAAHPRPQQRRRASRPCRADVLEAAEGMGYTRWAAAAPRRAAAGRAADDRRHPARGRSRRSASRPWPRSSADSLRRARPVHHRGPPDLLPDQDLPRRGPVGGAGVPRRLPAHQGRAAADAVGHARGPGRV